VSTRPKPPRLDRGTPLAQNQAMDPSTYAIEVNVASRFLDDQSAPHENRFVFAYTVDIRNRGEVPAKLVSRHWVITDANGKVQEVRGEGVVGEQPHMGPGEAFQYTSGAVLETAVGTMRGSYQMLADDGTRFDAQIPEFTLSIPRTLH
jgi:ApaG protein